MEKTGNEAVFAAQLKAKREQVNELLARYMGYEQEIDVELRKAMEYSLGGTGKRIRGAMVLWGCEVVCGECNSDAEAAAAAIEMVHTYSLVHDDLPAMDDDDMRRGRATCHKAFDEATAILAGDGLLTLAFEVVSKHVKDSAVAIRLVRALSEAAGASGMIAGQAADLRGEKMEPDREFLDYIHVNKTAKMLWCAALMGGIAGGADDEQMAALGEYGLKVGLAFQVADDILDVTASSEELGKTAGKDEKAGKVTYPALMGLEKSREVLERLSAEAVGSLDCFGARAEILRSLVVALAGRTY